MNRRKLILSSNFTTLCNVSGLAPLVLRLPSTQELSLVFRNPTLPSFDVWKLRLDFHAPVSVFPLAFLAPFQAAFNCCQRRSRQSHRHVDATAFSIHCLRRVHQPERCGDAEKPTRPNSTQGIQTRHERHVAVLR